MTTSDLPQELELESAVLYEPDPPLPDFAFDHLPDDLRARVASLGWTRPTPVQRKAIPYLSARRDMIVQARTGSGKTGAYLLPILEEIRTEDNWCQALILAPTRELARQVHQVLLELSSDTAVRSSIVYGGVRYGNQTKELREGAHIVVGTPGRVLDHIYRGTFSVQRVRTLILDEADEMLSMGFYPSMRKLRKQLPVDRTTHLFSATIPYHVEQLAHEFLRNPERLSLSRGNQTVSNLEHRYYVVPPLQKDRVLMRLIEHENPESAIIFTNTKRTAEYLSSVLGNVGIDAQHLTGDLPQNKRERIMGLLRAGSLRFLIATDVAARGIDISDLSHVILYDIPEHTEVYVHRSGRTARAGNTGIAITLCESLEERKLLTIAKQYNFSIEKYELPTDVDTRARMAERLFAYLENRLIGLSLLERERLAEFLPIAETMYEGEELRALLALLLEEAYTHGLYARLYEAEPPQEPKAADDGWTEDGPPQAKRRRGGRSRSRSGGRDHGGASGAR